MINRLLCWVFGHRWPTVVAAHARGHASILSAVRPTLIQRWIEAEVTLQCPRCGLAVISNTQHGMAPYEEKAS